MDIVIGGRGHGKTTRCIEHAAKTGAYIVCPSKSHVDHVWKMVREMGLLDKVRFPITFDEVLKGEFSSRGCTGFIFDNADIMIRQLCKGVPIELVSMTDENAWSMKVMDSLLVTGDDLIEDEKKNFTKEDREKIQKFYEKVVVPGLKTQVKGKFRDVESSGDVFSRELD